MLLCKGEQLVQCQASPGTAIVWGTIQVQHRLPCLCCSSADVAEQVEPSSKRMSLASETALCRSPCLTHAAMIDSGRPVPYTTRSNSSGSTFMVLLAAWSQAADPLLGVVST